MSIAEESFQQSFHVAPTAATSFRGGQQHGTPVRHPCRYQEGSRGVRTVDGRQVQATATLYTPARVQVTDFVWPPGADTEDVGQSRKPLNVYTRRDLETGEVDHYEVVL